MLLSANLHLYIFEINLFFKMSLSFHSETFFANLFFWFHIFFFVPWNKQLSKAAYMMSSPQELDIPLRRLNRSWGTSYNCIPGLEGTPFRYSTPPPGYLFCYFSTDCFARHNHRTSEWIETIKLWSLIVYSIND